MDGFRDLKSGEKFEIENKKIRESPYEYIRDFYEKLYPHVGRKVMSVLSLVPCSLILPSFYDELGKKTHTRISYLLLSPPATAKTSIGTHFKKFTYDAFPAEYITDAKLSSVLNFKTRVTLIVTDIARVFSNPILAKQIETIIGDEGKLSRFTAKTGDEEIPIDAVAYFAGTIENLEVTLREGNIFRVSPQIIFHTEGEHDEILAKENQTIGKGKPENFVDKEQVIIDYYQSLLDIQENRSKDKIEEITDYEITDEFREVIATRTIPLLRKMFKETDREYVRELHLVYRYLVSHAFLNIHNRKVKNGKLFVEKEDLGAALRLSKAELATKSMIIRRLNDMAERKWRNEKEFKMWVIEQHKNNNPLNTDEYKLLETLIKTK